MDHATQVALMRRIFGFLDTRTTEMAGQSYINEVASYTSATQLQRERDLLFRREPLFVGLSGDAAEPGSYFVHEETGIPILIVRLDSGQLNAFIAICRHRGAQIVAGCGKGSGKFTCPYHSWTYDDRGQLVARPCAEGFADLPDDSSSLKPLPIVERYGMIFVHPSAGDPIDIDAHLGGAQLELAPVGLQHYARFARHETQQAMNWKLVVDTFLEAYHVSSLHQRTLGPAILATPAAWDSFGRSSRMVAVRRSITEARHTPEAEWNLLDHSVVLYLLFPNTVLIHQLDHVEVVQAYPGPGGADSSHVVFSLYTPAPVTSDAQQRHFQANFDLLISVSQKEDFRIGEQIQRGFYSGAQDSIVYGRNEPGLGHFHRTIKEALG